MKIRFSTVSGVINRSLSESTEYFLPHALYISIIGMIGFPSYYWVWTYIFPQPYENLPLRLLGSALFGGLSLIHFKPTWMKPYTNFYWLVTMTYALPFFFTYMLLMNNGSMVWAMSMMAGLALLILLAYNWVLFTTAFSLGFLLALCAYVMTSKDVMLSNYLIQLPIYIFLIVTASITFYFPYKLKQEKLKVLASVGAEICHELRTPLMTIQNNAYGLNSNLPKLLHAYDLAKKHDLVTDPIRPDVLKAMEYSIQHIKNEVSHSNTIIDMLLMNLRKTELNTDDFVYLSMANTIQEALDRYPFDSQKSKQVVKADLNDDFAFFGSDLLMMHVIFNLIKNALAFTNDPTKTSIEITLDSDADANYIYFKDNGKGISHIERLSIFENFYSTNQKGIDSGTGIGLAFCKKVLTSFSAKIKCYSEPGEYTKFVLSFPKQQTIDGI